MTQAKSDRAAFAPLYERYLDPVYRYCYRRLGSREAAEDATSQIFIKAIAGLPGFREGSFPAWLFRIAANVVVDAARRARPYHPLDLAGDPADESLTPEEAAVEADERAGMHDLLTSLPADQRQALELRLVGLTGREIAEVMGRSTGAVKMLHLRAISRLRQELGVAFPTQEVDDAER